MPASHAAGKISVIDDVADAEDRLPQGNGGRLPYDSRHAVGSDDCESAPHVGGRQGCDERKRVGAGSSTS
jgi:hypothetical protein